eukprot:COSAG02_NODE_2669_length_8290_cov_8.246856_2_plen_312_part_00
MGGGERGWMGVVGKGGEREGAWGGQGEKWEWEGYPQQYASNKPPAVLSQQREWAGVGGSERQGEGLRPETHSRWGRAMRLHSPHHSHQRYHGHHQRHSHHSHYKRQRHHCQCQRHHHQRHHHQRHHHHHHHHHRCQRQRILSGHPTRELCVRDSHPSGAAETQRATHESPQRCVVAKLQGGRKGCGLPTRPWGQDTSTTQQLNDHALHAHMPGQAATRRSDGATQQTAVGIHWRQWATNSVWQCPGWANCSSIQCGLNTYHLHTHRHRQRAQQQGQQQGQHANSVTDGRDARACVAPRWLRFSFCMHDDNV